MLAAGVTTYGLPLGTKLTSWKQGVPKGGRIFSLSIYHLRYEEHFDILVLRVFLYKVISSYQIYNCNNRLWLLSVKMVK